jgi:integrase
VWTWLETADSLILTLAELETMLREPVRDKRYLDTRLGPSVKAYLSWKENEAGAAERTLDQYERDLAKMCAFLANHTIGEVTTDELREVRDTFPKGSRRRVTAVYRDFWRWLYQEGRIDSDPMARVRYPKGEPVRVLGVFTPDEEAQLISAQALIRDRLGVAVLLSAGLRAGEIRHLRVEDVDLTDGWSPCAAGKAGKVELCPSADGSYGCLKSSFWFRSPSLTASRGEARRLHPLPDGCRPVWADLERSIASDGAVHLLALVEPMLRAGGNPIPEATHVPPYVRDKADPYDWQCGGDPKGSRPCIRSNHDRCVYAPGSRRRGHRCGDDGSGRAKSFRSG